MTSIYCQIRRLFQSVKLRFVSNATILCTKSRKWYFFAFLDNNTLCTSWLSNGITFHNWYYTMLILKKKRIYTSPETIVVQSDLEGLLCTSGFKTLQVDELHNINADDTVTEQLYFEF